MSHRHLAVVVSVAAIVAAVPAVPFAHQTTKPAATKAVPQKTQSDEEKDTPIPLAQVPQAVRTTLSQYAKDSEIKSASKGDDDGTAVYEFDIEQSGRKLEVSITPKGEFFGSEEVVALADVPDAPRATIAKLGQGATVVSVEKAIDKKKAVTFEAVIDKAGKKTEYAVNPAGKVVGTEKVPAR